MFARESQRRSDGNGWGITSIAAHPGTARTDLLLNSAGPRSIQARVRRFAWFPFQPASYGALPPLFAATAAHAVPGGYYGPDRLGETRGHPVPAEVPAAADDRLAAAQLWDVSEEVVGMRFSKYAELPWLTLMRA
jgi:hypothetical protein